jgi:hypothetical protein
MSNIKNITQLRQRIKQLEENSERQKQQIKNDIAIIKDNLTPAGLLLNAFSGITGIKLNKDSVFKDGFAYTISMFIQQFILKSEKNLEKKLYEIIDSLFERIRHFVSSFISPEAKRNERKDEN